MQDFELKRFLDLASSAVEDGAEPHVANMKPKTAVKTRMAGARFSGSDIALCIQAVCLDGIANA